MTDLVLDASAARSLTDRIKTALEGTWHLIVEAYTQRAWTSLGYSSWDDYCTREFGTVRLRLPREERTEQISSMRDAGLSLRAISSATGHSVNTIRGELDKKVYQSDTPVVITGEDGKQYQSSKPWPEVRAAGQAIREAVDTTTGELLDDESATPTDELAEFEASLTTPPAQSTGPKRRPLPDQFFDATYDLIKAVERVQRLVEDDRFTRNAEQLGAKHRAELTRAADVLADVLRNFH